VAQCGTAVRRTGFHAPFFRQMSQTTAIRPDLTNELHKGR